jgi:predicted metal-dependent hydrolase
VRAPEFVSGESFSYLGRNYRLKIVRQPVEPLRFDGHHFWLAEDARDKAEAYFRRWYIHTGRGWLNERTPVLARKTGTEASRIEVRELGFRWGSCGKNGVLLFNWRLLQLPVRFIDYIIVHELVHLQEPHHSPEFWEAIDRALPAWRHLKEALRSDGARFLVFGMGALRSL